MGGLNEWKKKAPLNAASAPRKRESVIRCQLAAAVGAQWAKDRDPLYHVTEDFKNNFDLMGQRRAERFGITEETLGIREIAPGLSDAAGKKSDEGGQGAEAVRKSMADERFRRESDMDRMVEPTGYPGSRLFLSRFSQLAFQRGTLAAAVLRGTGKMMLFSCLKRTVGQSQPKNVRQRMLFEGASVRRNLAGSPPNQTLFNRGAVDGAVGLVVDVLRDARRTVNVLGEMAGGKNALPLGSGAETLQKMYPFLADDSERALLEEYREQLETAATPGDRALLQHAVVKTEALIGKKQYMKERFITALRQVEDSATTALTEFSQPGFSEEIFSLLQAAMPPEPPKPSKGDGGDKNGGPDEAQAP